MTITEDKNEKFSGASPLAQMRGLQRPHPQLLKTCCASYGSSARIVCLAHLGHSPGDTFFLPDPVHQSRIPVYESNCLLLQRNILAGGKYKEFWANYLHSCPTVDMEGVQEWIPPPNVIDLPPPVMDFFQFSLMF